MKKLTIKIANQIIDVFVQHPQIERKCKAYLCEGDAQFMLEMTAEDIEYERQKSAREDALEGRTPRAHSDVYLESIALQRKIAEKMFEFDTLLFHGSAVSVDGEAFLFTATSGTGKSTHTRLWCETFGDRAVMVNDDKPFLKITEDGVLAYGTPWNGKHGIGSNICVPLKAICILERGEENRIQQISGKDAVFMLLQQSNRPLRRELMPKYMELLDRISEKVAFYRMQCTMDPEAAIVAYETMSGKRYTND